jgi:hypothetical protein
MRRNAGWECRLVLIELVTLELLPYKTEEARFKKANDKDRKRDRLKKQVAFQHSYSLLSLSDTEVSRFNLFRNPLDHSSFAVTHYSNIILLSVPIS